MTKLGVVRIVGEAGLAGGTITGGAYAAKYGKEMVSLKEEKNQAVEDKQKAEEAKAKAEIEKKKAEAEKAVDSSDAHNIGMTLYLFIKYMSEQKALSVTQIKNELDKYKDCLFYYVSDSSGKDCITNNKTLYNKLTEIGTSFN